jgi:hypothetical protein
MAIIDQLVSVADVIARDPVTKAGLWMGIANINSSISIAMSEADARGGIGNELFYTYYHTKVMTVDIEQAAFGEAILALNSGTTVVIGAATVVQTDCLTTSASSAAQITLTPIGNVSVFLSDGSIQVVTPSTKDILLTGAPSQKITAIYETSKTVDLITIGTSTPPSIVDLTLTAQIRDKVTNGVKKYFQINIPAFQISGTYDLSLTADGISTEKLNGKALSNDAANCTSTNYYATVKYIPVVATSYYPSIAALPSTMSWAKSTAYSEPISVLGYKNGVFGSANITDQCTFARSGSSGSGITVGASTGVISTSASSTTIAETVRINVTYPSGSLVDYVMINIT